MNRTAALLVLLSSLALSAADQPAVKKASAPYTLPTSGEKVYLAYCASCHGAKGLGDGPVASSLKAPLPDLTTLAKRNQGQYPSARVSESIRGEALSKAHGTADMPVWGPVFRALDSRSEGATNIRVYNLVKHVESLQAK